MSRAEERSREYHVLTDADKARRRELLKRYRAFLRGLRELCHEHDIFPSFHYLEAAVYFHPIERLSEDSDWLRYPDDELYKTIDERIIEMYRDHRFLLTDRPLGTEVWKQDSYPEPNRVTTADIVARHEEARTAEEGELCHRHQLQDVEAVVVVEGEGPLCRTCARKLGYVPDGSA